MRITSLTHCSAKKSIEPTIFPQKKYSNINDFFNAWHTLLNQERPTSTAEALYNGRGIKELFNTNIEHDFYIISAGLGLIHKQDLIPSYSLTVSKGTDVSIDKFIENKFHSTEWWDLIIQNKYSRRSIEEITYESDVVLISLTSPYLFMLSEEIKKIKSKVILFTGDQSVLSKLGFSNLSSPYTDSFDGPNSLNKGAKIDFAQRIHSDFIRRYEQHPVIEKVLSSIEDDMFNWKKPKILKNHKQTDEEILNKIFENINNFNSISSLRRHFRHNLNVACEAKRFSKLYRNAKDIINEHAKN